MPLSSYFRLPALVFGFLVTCRAAEITPRVIDIWPEGVPGIHADASEEKKLEGGRVSNIHHPTLLVFPAEKPNGAALVYCPGGSYVRIAVGINGGLETQALNAMGVTVFILKYRLQEYGQPAPLQDVLRAIRWVRSGAVEFGVDPKRIGVIGGSAGGHLAGCASTMWDWPEGKTGAKLDEVNARPDFSIMIYPVVTMEDPFVHKTSRSSLLGKEPTRELMEKYSVEKQVRKDMPPVFLAATMADKTVPVENTLHLYEVLRNAGVPAEMHVYGQGSHGNSLDPQYGPTAQWPARCEEWMKFNGWLPK